MKKFKEGFTLAEVMIVLTVIGIISAIIMPIAIQNVPKKEIMMFKKGHNTLYQVISTLVNSDKYYKDGNLGIKADGTLISGDNTGDNEYLCETFSDIVSAKSVNCKKNATTSTYNDIVCSDWNYDGSMPKEKDAADSSCKNVAANLMDNEIITADGIIFYEVSKRKPFGYDKYMLSYSNEEHRLFFEKNSANYGGSSYVEYYHMDEFPDSYRCKKIFCMDIDGIGKGEDPFGYGIRLDGKIINGTKAQEWLDKGLTDE